MLIASRRVETLRRSEAKTVQERRLTEILAAAPPEGAGLKEVEPRECLTLDDAPGSGEFCGESYLSGQKADKLIRIWDGRVMPTECKVSNSALNSIKRLNREAAAKATAWVKDFGIMVVPTAVLSGVYKLRNLKDAQARGLTLFWSHDLQPLLDWIESTREGGAR